jgi:transcriptional regulator with XRE-family HTH domain
MTPFGAKLRELRKARGITLTEMAASLEISSAYLSALEHGKRGKPSPMLVRQICTFFTIIWDEAEELERLSRISHPRVAVDTAGLSPRATELANLLAERIGDLSEEELAALLSNLRSIKPKRGR